MSPLQNRDIFMSRKFDAKMLETVQKEKQQERLFIMSYL